MKLYLARHAQTNYNVQKRLNANPTVDVHLTEEGIEQAESLAEQLKDINFERIFISEFPRTRQTAEHVNRYHQLDLTVNPLINENRTGFDDQPTTEWYAALAEVEDRYAASFHDGESMNHAAERAREFIDFLRTQPHETVFVVTHGFITRAIYSYLTGRSLQEAYDEFDLAQGTFAEFEF